MKQEVLIQTVQSKASKLRNTDISTLSQHTFMLGRNIAVASMIDRDDQVDHHGT
jgi:hypothetical protein